MNVLKNDFDERGRISAGGALALAGVAIGALWLIGDPTISNNGAATQPEAGSSASADPTAGNSTETVEPKDDPPPPPKPKYYGIDVSLHPDSHGKYVKAALTDMKKAGCMVEPATKFTAESWGFVTVLQHNGHLIYPFETAQTLGPQSAKMITTAKKKKHPDCGASQNPNLWLPGCARTYSLHPKPGTICPDYNDPSDPDKNRSIKPDRKVPAGCPSSTVDGTSPLFFDVKVMCPGRPGQPEGTYKRNHMVSAKYKKPGGVVK